MGPPGPLPAAYGASSHRLRRRQASAAEAMPKSARVPGSGTVGSGTSPMVRTCVRESYENRVGPLPVTENGMFAPPGIPGRFIAIAASILTASSSGQIAASGGFDAKS